MKKIMKLWMLFIFIEPFISAYTNPDDCDFEEDSCRWSIQRFRISDNQLNNTKGRNHNKHIQDCNFLNGLCSCEEKDSNVPTTVIYNVTEFNSTWEESVLISVFDIYPGAKCLSFQYQMKDFKHSCIFIDVYSLCGQYWCSIWKSQSDHQLNGWNEISVTINVDKKSKIAIRFAHGNCFNVTYYISSISVKKKSCSDEVPTTTAAWTVNTSSYYSNEGVIIGIVIGGLAVTLAVLLIARCLHRRRATSPNANITKHSTVSSSGTTSGAARLKTENRDTSHSVKKQTTKFRDDTYDCTIMYPTNIPDPTYDHLNFKQNVNNMYDPSKSGTLNRDMGYIDHSFDTSIQRYMQDIDPTYDHTLKRPPENHTNALCGEKESQI
ncbi:hypothetical protein ACJMK2_021884 [Sinanodonta woodiana]|uniref:MAM domain-containing protein n=1 Tax=Sinanodonta woodiana TaxID=1069815 RepID=A0ABD3TJD3_SINWO